MKAASLTGIVAGRGVLHANLVRCVGVAFCAEHESPAVPLVKNSYKTNIRSSCEAELRLRQGSTTASRFIFYTALILIYFLRLPRAEKPDAVA